MCMCVCAMQVRGAFCETLNLHLVESGSREMSLKMIANKKLEATSAQKIPQNLLSLFFTKEQMANAMCTDSVDTAQSSYCWWHSLWDVCIGYCYKPMLYGI